MSEFVNYNKRSIQLPPGCKDLGDLFKPAWLRNLPRLIVPTDIPVVLRQDSFTETLGNIEKYTATVFDSRAVGCILMISSLDGKLDVSLSRLSETITSNVKFIYNEEQEAAMKSFFDRHGLVAPHAGEMPNEFGFRFPEMPVWSVFALSPMPSAATAFSIIASDLFRVFCGLNDQSELNFYLVEYEKAK